MINLKEHIPIWVVYSDVLWFRALGASKSYLGRELGVEELQSGSRRRCR